MFYSFLSKDIHQLGVADDFKSLLFELFVCTDFSNGFSHQEQLPPSADFYFGLSNKILIE